jgi:hypothetical protein
MTKRNKLNKRKAPPADGVSKYKRKKDEIQEGLREPFQHADAPAPEPVRLATPAVFSNDNLTGNNRPLPGPAKYDKLPWPVGSLITPAYEINTSQAFNSHGLIVPVANRGLQVGFLHAAKDTDGWHIANVLFNQNNLRTPVTTLQVTTQSVSAAGFRNTVGFMRDWCNVNYGNSFPMATRGYNPQAYQVTKITIIPKWIPSS